MVLRKKPGRRSAFLLQFLLEEIFAQTAERGKFEAHGAQKLEFTRSK